MKKPDPLIATPEKIVMSFISDYRDWNDRSYRIEKPRLRFWLYGFYEHRFERSEKAYRKLLDKYCGPDFEGQCITYGTHASHHPDREKIQSTKVTGDKATVKTIMVDVHGMDWEYEYRLKKEGDRWLLIALNYLDGNQKHPEL